MAWYLYKGTSKAEHEIYFGVSQDPVARVDGSHCVGGTKALAHWDTKDDEIDWSIVKEYQDQASALAVVRALEKQSAPGAWTIIQTAGIVLNTEQPDAS